MPKPLGINIFDQLKFVTNYMLAGCSGPRDLIFEMNTVAAKDLALMFVTFEGTKVTLKR